MTLHVERVSMGKGKQTQRRYSRPPERLGIPTCRENSVDGQGRSDRQCQQTDPLQVLEQGSRRQGRQSLLRIERFGDVVVGNVEVGGNVGRADGFDGVGNFCQQGG